MKNAEVQEVSKKPRSWIIDPIKSFQDGEKGEQNQTIIMEGWDEKTLHDPILWNAGKRAFDLIEKTLGGPVERSKIDDFFNKVPRELIKLWDDYIKDLDPMIKSGKVELYFDDSGKPRKELESLKINPDGYCACFKLEPYILMLDSLHETLNFRYGEDLFGYDRDVVAAYFTLEHVDSTAADVALNDVDSESYLLVTRWFEKIDAYEQTIDAINLRQEYLKITKSQSMNEKRHAKRNEAKRLVTNDWSQRKSEFRSAERAGNYYAEWLEGKGFEYEPRTITTWIRKYAKDNNIRLR